MRTGTDDIDAMMETIRLELGEASPPSPRVARQRATVDTVFARIKEEVLRRRKQTDDAAAALADYTGPWRPSVARLPRKSEYAIADFLPYTDRDLVETAYQAILRRPVDSEALTALLPQLRNGSMTKIELLAQLRWSAEGIERGVHVDGLLVPTMLQRLRRKRIIGPVVTWLHGLMRLGRSQQSQAAQLAAQSGELQELGRMFNDMSDKVQRIGDVNLIHARLDSLSHDVERLEAMYIQLRKEWDQRLLQEQLDKQAAEQLAEQVADRRAAEAAQAEEAADQSAHAYDALYSDFEDYFRGPEEVVRKRAEPYIGMIQQSGTVGAGAPVVDLGCGRGEWLGLLREHGIAARGVDMNRVFLASCRELDLDVIEGDAVEVLRSMPEASVGAITSMHLVEHLPFERVVELIDQAKRVLKTGGLMILETPNPENIDVATFGFYLDPTHRNPLPPQALSWLVDARGFDDVRIERLSEWRPLHVPTELTSDIAGAESINSLLQKRLAAPDYAIVARRP
ncbi:class I SAM-dependent methyltransferase [Lysobacter sp. GCM10012299]|uniref:class I SAM-dependent methyltransferase n=1 Tax=Lysobacter sp. GCM10012299 TaxID=3317333 RepID=UPI003606E4E0